MGDWISEPLQFIQIVGSIVKTIIGSLGDFGLMFSTVSTIYCTLLVIKNVGYSDD